MALHFVLDAATDARPGDEIVLTGAEAHHASAVRRVRVGEAVTIGDGRGVWLAGVCASAGPREVAVSVESRSEVAPARPRIVLAQALAKGDRDELAVQAATELGADEIIPWQAARSVSRWDAGKAEKGRARWSTIVREASKQAHRAWIPEVANLATTAQLAELAPSCVMVVLDPAAELRLTQLDLRSETRDIVLVVGPEGGIAPQELAELGGVGATPLRLGESVLRTSTAGPAALAVVSAAIGRW